MSPLCWSPTAWLYPFPSSDALVNLRLLLTAWAGAQGKWLRLFLVRVGILAFLGRSWLGGGCGVFLCVLVCCFFFF